MIKSNVLLALVIVVVVAAGIGFFMWPREGTILDESGNRIPADQVTREASGETIETTFRCSEGTLFMTSYDLGSNELTLTLSGGETYRLPQAVSASGARYATLDGSIVFWEHQGEARLERSGATTLEGCVVDTSAADTATSTASSTSSTINATTTIRIQ